MEMMGIKESKLLSFEGLKFSADNEPHHPLVGEIVTLWKGLIQV